MKHFCQVLEYDYKHQVTQSIWEIAHQIRLSRVLPLKKVTFSADLAEEKRMLLLPGMRRLCLALRMQLAIKEAAFLTTALLL